MMEEGISGGEVTVGSSAGERPGKPLRSRVEKLGAQGLEPRQGPLLVLFHEPRIADHVGRENSR